MPHPSTLSSDVCVDLADRAWERTLIEPTRSLSMARRALALASTRGDPALVARAEASVAYALRWLSRMDESEQMARQALQRQPPLLERLRAVVALAELHLARGDGAKCLPLLEQALEQVGARADLLLERGRLASLLGRTHFERFEHALAEQAFRRSSALHGRLDDRLGMAMSLMNIGSVRSRLGDFAGALESYQQSLSALEGQADAGRRPMVQYNLALVLEMMGDLQATRELCEDALAADLSANIFSVDILLLTLLGRVHGLLGEPRRARAALDRALHLARERDEPQRRETALAELGDLELLLGNPDAARTAFREGLADYDDAATTSANMHCRHGLARVQLELGQPAAALGIVDALLAGPDDRPDRVTRLQIMQTRARALQATGDPDAAAEGQRAVERLRRLTHDEHAAACAEHMTLLQRLERARTREERLSVRVDEQDARLAEAADERTELQDQLRVSQRMEAMGRLAAGVAHDFNNLLTVVFGNTEELLGEPLSACQREAAQGVLQAAERANDLTRRLLAFSRRQALKPQAVSLDDVLRELAPVLERLAGSDVTLEPVLDGDAGLVHVDQIQLEQILLNLVSNAADAMPDGGRLQLTTSRVRVDGPLPGALYELEPGDYARLAVTDSGVGISRELHARIFEPFFSTKDAARGTGLGLSTVYGVARQSGGGLAVHSEPGRGCTIEVFLPLAQACQLEPPAPVLPAPDIVPEGRAINVLLVEDDSALRAMVARGLRREGLCVTEAGDGEQALALVRGGELQLEVLVTDLDMPRMGGRRLLAHLRERQPELCCVFTSGHRQRDDAVQVPGVSWLPKPFSIAELGRLVRREPTQPD
ncbi:MAG: hypothetical protein DRQ55_05430 [Planctomycetota bacterium]|nr:MAG: hypothetical protein DRQ55_05430 [Planctomycetota bacterium]